MIEIKVDRRSQEVLLKIPKLKKIQPENIEQALKDIGDEVVDETRRLIKRGNKTGRIYNFRGRRHQASAPAEEPADRTGRLRRSSNYNVRNQQQMSIGESVDYALFLEKGTRRMKPRPHIISAIHNKAGITYSILEKAGKI